MTNSVKKNLNREAFYRCFNDNGIEAGINSFLPISRKDYLVEKIKYILHRIGILNKIKAIIK